MRQWSDLPDDRAALILFVVDDLRTESIEGKVEFFQVGQGVSQSILLVFGAIEKKEPASTGAEELSAGRTVLPSALVTVVDPIVGDMGRERFF